MHSWTCFCKPSQQHNDYYQWPSNKTHHIIGTRRIARETIDQHYLWLRIFFLFLSLFLGVDQYLAILYPLEYSTKVTRRSSWKLISLVWTLGLGASILGGLQLTVSPHSPWAACRHALKSRPQQWWLSSQVHRAWIAGKLIWPSVC